LEEEEHAFCAEPGSQQEGRADHSGKHQERPEILITVTMQQKQSTSNPFTG
jgi:hypothetical protein